MTKRLRRPHGCKRQYRSSDSSRTFHSFSRMLGTLSLVFSLSLFVESKSNEFNSLIPILGLKQCDNREELNAIDLNSNKFPMIQALRAGDDDPSNNKLDKANDRIQEEIHSLISDFKLEVRDTFQTLQEDLEKQNAMKAPKRKKKATKKKGGSRQRNLKAKETEVFKNSDGDKSLSGDSVVVTGPSNASFTIETQHEKVMESSCHSTADAKVIESNDEEKNVVDSGKGSKLGALQNVFRQFLLSVKESIGNDDLDWEYVISDKEASALQKNNKRKEGTGINEQGEGMTSLVLEESIELKKSSLGISPPDRQTLIEQNTQNETGAILDQRIETKKGLSSVQSKESEKLEQQKSADKTFHFNWFQSLKSRLNTSASGNISGEFISDKSKTKKSTVRVHRNTTDITKGEIGYNKSAFAFFRKWHEPEIKAENGLAQNSTLGGFRSKRGHTSNGTLPSKRKFAFSLFKNETHTDSTKLKNIVNETTRKKSTKRNVQKDNVRTLNGAKTTSLTTSKDNFDLLKSNSLSLTHWTWGSKPKNIVSSTNSSSTKKKEKKNQQTTTQKAKNNSTKIKLFGFLNQTNFDDLAVFPPITLNEKQIRRKRKKRRIVEDKNDLVNESKVLSRQLLGAKKEINALLLSHRTRVLLKLVLFTALYFILNISVQILLKLILKK